MDLTLSEYLFSFDYLQRKMHSFIYKKEIGCSSSYEYNRFQ